MDIIGDAGVSLDLLSVKSKRQYSTVKDEFFRFRNDDLSWNNAENVVSTYMNLDYFCNLTIDSTVRSWFELKFDHLIENVNHIWDGASSAFK